MPLKHDTPANRHGLIAAIAHHIEKPYFALPGTALYRARLCALTGQILAPACGSWLARLPLPRAEPEAAGFAEVSAFEAPRR